MIFRDEDTQTEYHKLDIDLQISLAEFEQLISAMGYLIDVQHADSENKDLEIVVRVAN